MEEVKPREELVKLVETINETVQLPDGLHIELASDERAQEMVDFLIQHFYPDETLSKSLNRVIDEYVNGLLLDRFKDNLSLLLVSKISSKVVGVRTIKVISRAQTVNVENVKDEVLRKIITFLHHKDDEMDVFKYFGVEYAVSFINLAIHKDYRNKGLASKLMTAALLFAKDIGLEPACVAGEGTSTYSQKIYYKFGFELLHTVKYEDYKVDGEVVFKNTGDNETCKFYVKKL